MSFSIPETTCTCVMKAVELKIGAAHSTFLRRCNHKKEALGCFWLLYLINQVSEEVHQDACHPFPSSLGRFWVVLEICTEFLCVHKG